MAAAHSAAAEAAAAETAGIGRRSCGDETGCAERRDRGDGEHRGTNPGQHGSLLGAFALGRIDRSGIGRRPPTNRFIAGAQNRRFAAETPVHSMFIWLKLLAD
jgi:hypothetical protein